MDEQRKRLPPYVSYRTFSNFVSGLQQNMPSRIDRSYWGEFLSGSTGIQLMSALRFLGLIDANGWPTLLLKSLISATAEQKAAVLREIASESYGFVLKSSLLEPSSATSAQLQEAFKGTFQLADDVSRKCIKFFIALATDAGIPLSPFITKKTRSTHTGSGTKTTVKKTGIRTNRNVEVPKQIEEMTNKALWNKMLLEKFPTFDPTWSDEIKQKWFAAFDELLKMSFQDGRLQH